MLAGWGVGQQLRPGGGGPSSLALAGFGARFCAGSARMFRWIELAGTAQYSSLLTLCAFMLAALSLLMWIMSTSGECCICVPCMYS